MYYHEHAGVKGNVRADVLAGKTTITGGLRVEEKAETRMTASILIFHLFDRLTVKCRFVALQSGLPRKYADCVFVSNK